MQDTELEHQCPNCHAILRGVTSTNGDFKPEPGSPTVCERCASICIFDKELQLRLATDEDINNIRIIDAGCFATLLATQQFFMQRIKQN